jgi:hypothetical protein
MHLRPFGNLARRDLAEPEIAEGGLLAPTRSTRQVKVWLTTCTRSAPAR